MGNNLIVFIHGKAFSGKDSIYHTLRLNSIDTITFTDYDKHVSFVNEFFEDKQTAKDKTPDIIRLPFADEVKRELCRIKPEVDFDKLMSDPAYKSQYRKELVEIGDGYRKDDIDCWVNKHRDNFFPLLEQSDKKMFVITDARYCNEMEYAKEIEYHNKYSNNNSVVITVKVWADLPTRLNRMSVESAYKYLKYSKNNRGEMMEEYALENNNPINFDIVVNNNIDHKRYINIYEDLSVQTYQISKLFNKIRGK